MPRSANLAAAVLTEVAAGAQQAAIPRTMSTGLAASLLQEVTHGLRSAFDQVAGLDETYFYGPEDVDFCLRLRERGWRIVQLEAALVHHPPRRRNRRLFTRRGMRHARAVCRHLWRHRRFKSGVAT